MLMKLVYMQEESRILQELNKPALDTTNAFDCSSQEESLSAKKRTLCIERITSETCEEEQITNQTEDQYTEMDQIKYKFQVFWKSEDAFRRLDYCGNLRGIFL